MPMDAPSDMGGALRQKVRPIERVGSSVSHVQAHSFPLSLLRLLSLLTPTSLLSGTSSSCQFLNFRVYQLLGESGTYYSFHFGKSIPWVSQFPFGVIKDPQYVGKYYEPSCMSILNPFPVHSTVDSRLCLHDPCRIYCGFSFMPA
ncbi:phospholipid N-methyltransferase [Actinidia rufa]|uniref:Phospholipid N-methyltransferase n=1 Tax=Actinidia rufa TaxID=165716 RepID=A0A7J0FZ92_9ERIC|nr:phospholipid N-methyltransferase [Actinidia rufa]